MRRPSSIKPFLLATLAFAGLLAGCAGQHVRPSANYADAPPKVVRVAFDQNGDLYPRKPDEVDWVSPKPTLLDKTLGREFSLRLLTKKSPVPYEPAARLIAEKSAQEELRRALVDADTLVVLIMGFNVSYSDAIDSFALLRNRVPLLSANNVATVEVIWDGLVPQSEDDLSTLSKFTFWNKALTYSNLAGQCGLRRLLAAVDRPVKLRFLTHSRGAAVALSSLANPMYDNDIIVHCGRDFPPLDASQFIDVKIAAFAPAIGNGHLTSELDAQLRSHKKPLQLALGINERDVATSKSFLPARSRGDTRLGSDVKYGSTEAGKTRQNVDFVGVGFNHGSNHSLKAYLDSNPQARDCLLEFAALTSGSTPNCEQFVLYRSAR